MAYYTIKPSEDFVARTMCKIHKIETRKKAITHVASFGIALTPFLVRRVWFIMRGDYFAVSQWPMGHQISEAYTLFLSPVAGYACAVFALGMVSTYLLKKHTANTILLRVGH